MNKKTYHIGKQTKFEIVIKIKKSLQMLSLKGVTTNTVLVTLVTMAVICAIFIPSVCSVICAAVAIGSISLGRLFIAVIN